jgi:hypothetical protein
MSKSISDDQDRRGRLGMLEDRIQDNRYGDSVDRIPSIVSVYMT